MSAWQVPCYFTLKPGEFIQGLLATIAQHCRVYVVTVPAPAEHARVAGLAAGRQITQAQGINIKLVSTCLGHSKPSITLDIYAHVMREDQEQVVQALDQWFNDHAAAV